MHTFLNNVFNQAYIQNIQIHIREVKYWQTYNLLRHELYTMIKSVFVKIRRILLRIVGAK